MSFTDSPPDWLGGVDLFPMASARPVPAALLERRAAGMALYHDTNRRASVRVDARPESATAERPPLSFTTGVIPKAAPVKLEPSAEATSAAIAAADVALADATYRSLFGDDGNSPAVATAPRKEARMTVNAGIQPGGSYPSAEDLEADRIEAALKGTDLAPVVSSEDEALYRSLFGVNG